MQTGRHYTGQYRSKCGSKQYTAIRCGTDHHLFQDHKKDRIHHKIHHKKYVYIQFIVHIRPSFSFSCTKRICCFQHLTLYGFCKKEFVRRCKVYLFSFDRSRNLQNVLELFRNSWKVLEYFRKRVLRRLSTPEYSFLFIIIMSVQF